MTARDTLVLLAALAGMALTARLGVWQLDRADQKGQLQADLDTRGALPPLSLPELAATEAEALVQVHRRAQLSGTWLPDFTVRLDNRQMNGLVGFHVLTPLRLADGSAVLVQRGWQPRNFEDRTLLAPVPTADGEVQLAGTLARNPARLYEFEGGVSGPIRQNLELEAFGRETGLPLRPVSLLQTSDADDGLKREWSRPATGIDKHHGYAFQWFALCALIAGLFTWFRIIRPRRARKSTHPRP